MARKAPRPRRPKARGHHAAKPDPLDVVIVEYARTLGLTIDTAWMPAVRANLQVILRHGRLVAEFALPGETESAAVAES